MKKLILFTGMAIMMASCGTQKSLTNETPPEIKKSVMSGAGIISGYTLPIRGVVPGYVVYATQPSEKILINDTIYVWQINKSQNGKNLFLVREEQDSVINKIILTEFSAFESRQINSKVGMSGLFMRPNSALLKMIQQKTANSNGGSNVSKALSLLEGEIKRTNADYSSAYSFWKADSVEWAKDGMGPSEKSKNLLEIESQKRSLDKIKDSLLFQKGEELIARSLLEDWIINDGGLYLLTDLYTVSVLQSAKLTTQDISTTGGSGGNDNNNIDPTELVEDYCYNCYNPYYPYYKDSSGKEHNICRANSDKYHSFQHKQKPHPKPQEVARGYNNNRHPSYNRGGYFLSTPDYYGSHTVWYSYRRPVWYYGYGW